MNNTNTPNRNEELNMDNTSNYLKELFNTPIEIQDTTHFVKTKIAQAVDNTYGPIERRILARTKADLSDINPETTNWSNVIELSDGRKIVGQKTPEQMLAEAGI